MLGSSERGVVIAAGPGIHLQEAYRLAQLARQYESEVRVFCKGLAANGSSVLELMRLGARRGASIEVEVSGPDAEVAALAICDLMEESVDMQTEVSLVG